MEEKRVRILQALEEAKSLVEDGKEIPNDYAKILFPPERREYELTYYGKESEESIISNTMAVPLQQDRVFPKNVDLNESEWVNKLIFGENLQVLKRLLEMKENGELKNADGTNGIRLIYIDPPFATKKDFTAKDDEQKAYADKISGAKFLEELRKRIVMLKELLAEDGTIWVHLDYRKCHYIKVLMDEIFNESNCINEIIWSYTSGGAGERTFSKKHDNIFVYGKTHDYKFNKQLTRRYVDKSKGYDPRIEYYKDENGREYRVNIMTDVWSDIGIISPNGFERTGYPTQKPEELLERIIKASSDEGDIVLDCFAGSGTTPVVAEKLNRRWIAIDVGKLSMYTIQKRLLNLKDKNNKKIVAKPFVQYFAGLYDAEKLNNFNENDWTLFALSLWNCKAEQTTIKGFTFNGKKKSNFVKVYTPQELQRLGAKISHETLENIDASIGSMLGSEVFIIAPKGQFAFAEDDVELKNCTYHILRIPYSMLAKFTESFTALAQPKESSNINEIVESVGYDFIQAPTVEYEIKQDQLIIKSFRSNSRLRGETETELSMVLIDYDYDGEIFDLDDVLYSKNDFKDGKAKINISKMGKQMMFKFIDTAGNEKGVVYRG